MKGAASRQQEKISGPGTGGFFCLLSSASLSTRQANTVLAVLGAGLLLLFFKGASDQNTQRMTTFLAGFGGAVALYGVAAWVVCRAPTARSTFVLGLVFAGLFRVAPLTTDTYLSTDLYRYIWDGKMQANGVNPNRFVPGDWHLEH